MNKVYDYHKEVADYRASVGDNHAISGRWFWRRNLHGWEDVPFEYMYPAEIWEYEQGELKVYAPKGRAIQSEKPITLDEKLG